MDGGQAHQSQQRPSHACLAMTIHVGMVQLLSIWLGYEANAGVQVLAEALGDVGEAVEPGKHVLNCHKELILMYDKFT